MAVATRTAEGYEIRPARKRKNRLNRALKGLDDSSQAVQKLGGNWLKSKGLEKSDSE